MVLYARDIVAKEFVSLPKGTSALEAARHMIEKKHGFVVVVSSDGRPEGMVTEWDYVSRLVAEGRDPARTTLGEMMTQELVTVKASDGIDQVAKVMSEKRIRRVLVTDDGKVVGVVTSRTLVGNLNEYVDRISSQIARLQGPPF